MSIDDSQQHMCSELQHLDRIVRQKNCRCVEHKQVLAAIHISLQQMTADHLNVSVDVADFEVDIVAWLHSILDCLDIDVVKVQQARSRRYTHILRSSLKRVHELNIVSLLPKLIPFTLDIY